MPSTRHCEHVKANGRFCGSPAMRGRNYCHFHLVHIGRQLRIERYASLGLRRPPLELPLLEDAASIQLALMQVTEALLDGSLEHKAAGLVLYSLQTAAINLRTMQKEAEADAEAGNAICNRYDSFEQDYDLGDCRHLRVEETTDEDNIQAQAAEIVEGAKYAGLIQDEAGEKRAGDAQDAGAIESFDAEDNDSVPTLGPVNYLDSEAVDRSVRIPLMLSRVQYEQAKVSIFGYEMMHGIDRKHREGRKPVAQRPAISQKIVLNPRKPMSSVTIEEGWQQLEAGGQA